jgi:large subunit ribosomal protein L31
MKAGIHPTYYPEAKVTCACGHTWTTGSTLPEIRTDICSNCHPFYTGEQRIVDAAGQVERFMGRLKQYGAFTEAAEERAVKAQEKLEKTFLNQQLIALDLPDRLFQILSDADYVTVGDVVTKLEDDENGLLELTGFGPKALEQLKEKIAVIRKTFEASRIN